MRIALVILVTAVLPACAGTVDRNAVLEADGAAQQLLCGPEEVAFCVDAHCSPSEFHCVSRASLRKLFEGGGFRGN